MKNKSPIVQLRKEMMKELKQIKMDNVKLSLQCDSRTTQLSLVYSIPHDVGFVNGERKIKKRQKRKYIPYKLAERHAFITNLKNIIGPIYKEQTEVIKGIGSEKDTLIYWIKTYTENPQRKGNFIVSERSLQSDKQSLTFLNKYIEKHRPRFKNIWSWVDEKKSKEFLLEYLNHRKENGGERGRKWSDSTVHGNYSRIRAFFNFVGTKIDGFPKGIVDELPIRTPQVETFTFTKMEMRKCIEFLEAHKDDPKYVWFRPFFLLMAETGMRIGEAVRLEIDKVDMDERKILVKGKGRNGGKERYVYVRSDNVWKIIEDNILDNGKVKAGKYIFHRKFQNTSYGKTFIVENQDEHFTEDGVRNRFKDMIVELNLNTKLTPHALRRFFITEMLKKTNGNIPLIAQLVGHSTWDIVRRYTKNVVDENIDVNVGVI